MKKLAFTFVLVSSFGISAIAQKANQSVVSITLPATVAEDEVVETIQKADFDADLHIDQLFDKMALIESLIYSEKELKAMTNEHLKPSATLSYFGQTQN